MNGQDSLSATLETALATRPEVAVRADRCRAVLSDLLATDSSQHRREVSLLVAAVEEGVPEALRNAGTTAAVDVIAERFAAERALETTAARWSVQCWSDALTTVTGDTIPALSDPAPVETTLLGGDLSAAVSTAGSELAAATTVPKSAPAVLNKPAAAARDVSQPKRRSGLYAAAAGVVAIAIVVASFAIANGHSAKKLKVQTTTHLTSKDLSFKNESINSSVMLTRDWRIGGTDGNTVTGTVTFMNLQSKIAPFAYDEVIPESLAKSSNDVRVSVLPKQLTVKWESNDPVLHVTGTIAPNASWTLHYFIKVSAAGADSHRLLGWEADRDAAIQTWDAAPRFNITAPKSGGAATSPVPRYRIRGTIQSGATIAYLGVRRTPALGTHHYGAIAPTHNDWVQNVPLSLGPNYIFFETTNSAGNHFFPKPVRVTYALPSAPIAPPAATSTGGAPQPNPGPTVNPPPTSASTTTTTTMQMPAAKIYITGDSSVFADCDGTYTFHPTNYTAAAWTNFGTTQTITLKFPSDSDYSDYTQTITAWAQNGAGPKVTAAFVVHVTAHPPGPFNCP